MPPAIQFSVFIGAMGLLFNSSPIAYAQVDLEEDKPIETGPTVDVEMNSEQEPHTETDPKQQKESKTEHEKTDSKGKTDERQNIVDISPIEHEEEKPIGEGRFELGSYFRSEDDGTMFELSPLFSGWIGVYGAIECTLDWGFAFFNSSINLDDTYNYFIVGNPWFGARLMTEEGRTLSHIGVGIAAPLAWLPEKNTKNYTQFEAAYLTASAIRGLYNHWLWMPEHLGVTFSIDSEMTTENDIYLKGEAAGSVMVQVGDYMNQKAKIYLQIGGELGVGTERVKLGGRLQGVGIPVGDDDRIQFSLGPFLRVNLDRGYLRANLLINIDKRYGIFDGQSIFGLHLGAGSRFDS